MHQNLRLQVPKINQCANKNYQVLNLTTTLMNFLKAKNGSKNGLRFVRKCCTPKIAAVSLSTMIIIGWLRLRELRGTAHLWTTPNVKNAMHQQFREAETNAEEATLTQTSIHTNWQLPWQWEKTMGLSINGRSNQTTIAIMEPPVSWGTPRTKPHGLQKRLKS